MFGCTQQEQYEETHKAEEVQEETNEKNEFWKEEERQTKTVATTPAPAPCRTFAQILDDSNEASRKDDNSGCKVLRDKADDLCADIAHNGKTCTRTCLARMEAQKSYCGAMVQCPVLWRYVIFPNPT